MPKFYIHMKVNGRLIKEIDAPTVEDAIKNIKTSSAEAFQNADFGDLEDSDAVYTCLEDENGNYVHESD